MSQLKKPPQNPLIIFTTRRLGEKEEDLFKNCEKYLICNPPLENLEVYWNENTSSQKTNHAEIRKIQRGNIFAYLHLPHGAISIKNAKPFIKALYQDALLLSHSPKTIDAIYLVLHAGDIAMEDAFFRLLPKKGKKALGELLNISSDVFFEVIAFIHEPQSPIFRLLSEYKEKDKQAITLVQKIETEKYKKSCEAFKRKLSPKLRSLSVRNKTLTLNKVEKNEWKEIYKPFIFDTNEAVKGYWNKTNQLFQKGTFSFEDFKYHLNQLIKNIN